MDDCPGIRWAWLQLPSIAFSDLSRLDRDSSYHIATSKSNHQLELTDQHHDRSRLEEALAWAKIALSYLADFVS